MSPAGVLVQTGGPLPPGTNSATVRAVGFVRFLVVITLFTYGTSTSTGSTALYGIRLQPARTSQGAATPWCNLWWTGGPHQVLSQSVFTSTHIRSMDDKPPPSLGSRPSDLCTVWYRTRWYLCDFFGTVVRILSLLYYCSYPLVARAQGVEPCDLPGVFLGFQL